MSKENHRNETMRRYLSKTSSSQALHQQMVGLLPGGIGGSAPTYEPYPIAVKTAEGSRIWDIDDNMYLDFNLCWGVLMVGHRHPRIIDGLQEQLENGTMYGLPHEEILDTARELSSRFPPMEKLRFVNSGSEATLYAVRLARRYTGKDKIVKIEGSYHGVMDSLHISKRPSKGEYGPRRRPTPIPYGRGITEGTLKDTLIAPFNDIEVISELLEENLGEISAVIVEPTMMNAGVIPPQKKYLQELREVTEEHNVLLIFDEVKTGAKLAPGGATEYFDVEPDLISLAKAIGGGMPIGACGGRAEIMDGIGDEGLFGTFSANPMSIRAARITLTEILTAQAYNHIKKLGIQLMKGYEDVIKDHRIDAVVQGINAVGGILFTNEPVTDYRTWAKVDEERTMDYWLSMLNEGVIPMACGADEEWLVSVQHTEEDIEGHLEAFKRVAAEI
ncbi:aspartate aminotransferase family protein [Candidatus Thorarchaeota archaeon]|nr:MAG: aspartate aminotransferase family protein [Candidatus Thorarchaeota archaeon]